MREEWMLQLLWRKGFRTQNKRTNQRRQNDNMKRKLIHYGLSLATAVLALTGAVAPVNAADKKPNILIIWGDDIGYWNISAYNQGMQRVLEGDGGNAYYRWFGGDSK
jgi:hypothetical protein